MNKGNLTKKKSRINLNFGDKEKALISAKRDLEQMNQIRSSNAELTEANNKLANELEKAKKRSDNKEYRRTERSYELQRVPFPSRDVKIHPSTPKFEFKPSLTVGSWLFAVETQFKINNFPAHTKVSCFLTFFMGTPHDFTVHHLQTMPYLTWNCLRK